MKIEKPIKIRIPRFFIPEYISKKYMNIAKMYNLIKKLKKQINYETRLSRQTTKTTPKGYNIT